MMKLKPLSPTLRERKRYVVFEVLSKHHPKNSFRLAEAIHASLLSLVGTLGAAKAGIIFLHDKFDEKTQRGIIRVTHTMVDALCSAFVMTTTLEGQPVIIHSKGISGIMNKAINKFIQTEG